VLAKSDDPADAAALDETLATLSEGVRALAVLLWPFLPSRAPRMLAAVGEAGDDVGFDRAVIGNGSGRTVDASGGSLFPRVDTPAA
jgi:methionyl-tRNA synthetase